MIECMRTAAKKQQTNADWIRSMTDEELAKWFDAVTKDVLGGSCLLYTSPSPRDA